MATLGLLTLWSMDVKFTEVQNMEQALTKTVNAAYFGGLQTWPTLQRWPLIGGPHPTGGLGDANQRQRGSHLVNTISFIQTEGVQVMPMPTSGRPENRKGLSSNQTCQC